MDGDEAALAIARVRQTQKRLAGRAHWPFHRHAMFGLSEGLLVSAVAQPVQLALPMIGAGLALIAVCILQDRRRDGMFVSGWRAGRTRALTVTLTVFVLLMGVLSACLRNGEAAQPIGYLVGLVTWAVCTIASLRWERTYRAELLSGLDQ